MIFWNRNIGFKRSVTVHMTCMSEILVYSHEWVKKVTVIPHCFGSFYLTIYFCLYIYSYTYTDMFVNCNAKIIKCTSQWEFPSSLVQDDRLPLNLVGMCDVSLTYCVHREWELPQLGDQIPSSASQTSSSGQPNWNLSESYDQKLQQSIKVRMDLVCQCVLICELMLQ